MLSVIAIAQRCMWIAFLAAATFLLLELGTAVPQWQQESEAITSDIHAQSMAAFQTQLSLRAGIGIVATSANAIAADWINGTSVVALSILDKRLAETNRVLEAAVVNGTVQLGAVNGTLAAAEKDILAVTTQAAQVESQASETLRQVNSAMPLFLECDHNPDCLFNRVQGTSKGIEKMAQAWGREAAPISHHVEQTTADVQRIADEFSKPKSFGSKLWSGFKAAAWGLKFLF